MVESNRGFDRTYSSLPVLVVRDYSVLSETLLREAYACIQRHRREYRYEVLTHEYWVRLVDQVTRSGSVKHLMHLHSPRNIRCDFLDR